MPFFSGIAIALHVFIQNYHIKTGKRINIHNRIRKFNKKISIFASDYSDFVTIFVVFLCFVINHILAKFKNALALVTSQSQYVIKLSLALTELQFTLFYITNFSFKINQKNLLSETSGNFTTSKKV